MDASKIIAKGRISVKTMLAFAVVLIVGLIAIYAEYRPNVPTNMPGEYLVFVSIAGALEKCHWHILTETELITYFLWFPVRHRFCDDIHQIVYLPALNNGDPGIMIVLNGCERFDWRNKTATNFKREHPIACITMYVGKDDIHQLVRRIEKHWGQIERRRLLDSNST